MLRDSGPRSQRDKQENEGEKNQIKKKKHELLFWLIRNLKSEKMSFKVLDVICRLGRLCVDFERSFPLWLLRFPPTDQ